MHRGFEGMSRNAALASVPGTEVLGPRRCGIDELVDRGPAAGAGKTPDVNRVAQRPIAQRLQLHSGAPAASLNVATPDFVLCL
jgi:hypothetical protein